ncbi:chorismate mutase [Tepidibacter aestuarii]|nr:chorismate mutase [Tepidibacter aestuarii]
MIVFKNIKYEIHLFMKNRQGGLDLTKKIFYLIDEEVVPDVYRKVIEVKKILSSGKVNQVTEAVKIVGISRGAFYKYKDYVFLSSNDQLGNIVTFSMFLDHTKGVLSATLNRLADFGCNVITINQNIPINDVASLTLTVDTKDMSISIEDVIEKVKELNGVCSLQILARE